MYPVIWSEKAKRNYAEIIDTLNGWRRPGLRLGQMDCEGRSG